LFRSAGVAAQPVALALVVAVEPRLFGVGFDHRGPGHHQTCGHLVSLGRGEVVSLGCVSAAAARSSLVAVVAVMVGVWIHLRWSLLYIVSRITVRRSPASGPGWCRRAPGSCADLV